MGLHRYLKKKRVYRYPRIRRKRQKPNLDKESMHSISDIINERKAFGQWEGDLIVFKQTKTNVFTLRERKSRFLMAIQHANRKAKGTSKTLINYREDKVGMMVLSHWIMIQLLQITRGCLKLSNRISISVIPINSTRKGR